jgi:hypothetical protein
MSELMATLRDVMCFKCSVTGRLAHYKSRQLTITDGKIKHFVNVQGFQCNSCKNISLALDDHYKIQNIYGLSYTLCPESLIKPVMKNGHEEWVLKVRSMEVTPYETLDRNLKTTKAFLNRINGK